MESRPLGRGVADPVEIRPSPFVSPCQKFRVKYGMKYAVKIDPSFHLSKSLKVIGTDTDR